MSIKSIFIIETPLSYINALEAQSFFRIQPKDSILIFVTSSNININRLLNMLDKNNWGEIYSLYFNIEHRRHKELKRGRFFDLFYFKKALLKINNIFKKYKKIKFLISGYYTHEMSLHSLNKTSFTEFILIDDGAMTLSTNKNRINEFKYSFKHTLKYNGRINLGLKLYFKYFLGLIDNGAQMITFFSVYKLSTISNDMYYKNNLNNLKSKIITKKKDDKIFYIGSPFSESLPISINDNSLTIMIERMLDIYGVKNFVYIPHRNESLKIINFLSEKYNFEIKHLEVPIEFFLSTTNFLPKTIVSCFSSALFNICEILPEEINIESIYIPENILIDNWNKQNIINLYETIKKNNKIKIRNIKW